MHAVSPALLSDARILAAYLIFFGSYFVFALGKFPGMKIDRPGAAIIGAVLMFALRILSPGDALRYVDFATIVLLFAMMMLVGNLRLAGFFERVASAVVERIGERHLLPAVLFSTGLLSAFFVNDIICLAMVPLVLTATRRLGVKPLPYLLAVATASNIGSVATITGNPQNMLIGSVSHTRYLDFLAHLAPVAVLGLCVDWALIHWMFLRNGLDRVEVREAIAPGSANRSLRTKPIVVLALVLAGFLAGAPPAMAAALGAALLLITRTVEPRKVYDEIDWGLLVFFVGLFIIVGGAERAWLVCSISSPEIRSGQSPEYFFTTLRKRTVPAAAGSWVVTPCTSKSSLASGKKSALLAGVLGVHSRISGRVLPAGAASHQVSRFPSSACAALWARLKLSAVRLPPAARVVAKVSLTNCDSRLKVST